LKIKCLSDVWQSVENQGFRSTPKPLQSHSKATPKQQTVENQALDEIFWSFGVILGKYVLFDPPTHRLTSQSIGTIFAVKMPVFSIHISITPKTPKKNTKPLKIKGLRLWSSLWSGFGVALEFLALLLKIYYTKSSPYPTPCPASP